MPQKQQKIIKINRLWKGKFASLRDYQVEEAIKEKKDLKIILLITNETMTIPYEEITKRMIKHKEKIKSRIKKEQEYTLVDFVWKPDPDLRNLKDFSKLVL